MLGESTDTGQGYRSVADFIRGGVLTREHKITPKHESRQQIEWFFLDLFSTSQTSPLKNTEIHLTCASEICINNAPYFAFKKQQHSYGVVQGCCNNWNCPRCGILRAKKEYGRIVEGCRTLSETEELWFITITCRGKEMSVNEAETSYLQWTNRLFTRWRTYAARHNQTWCYVQVTERQKRKHPHSHILTTWRPPDIVVGKKDKWETTNTGGKSRVEVDALLSAYVRDSCVDVGLGSQYDLSRVQSVEGASRYVAKYLFKPEIFATVWPKGWKRVRYSQNFPKLEEKETNAFVLMTREDWQKLARLALIITSDSNTTKSVIYSHLRGADVILK